MSGQVSRTRARELARTFLERGDARGWFEALYKEADGDPSRIPWADLTPNPNLTSWLAARTLVGNGKRALVVGCGLGDDAEALAGLGFSVTAFDISAEAIRWCQKRFPASTINYVVGDVLDIPPAWHGQFDFILEIYTLQVLPQELRGRAIQGLAACLAVNGEILLVARGREAHEDRGSMPWPLLKTEVRTFMDHGLTEVNFEDIFDDEVPPVRRFRVLYRKQTPTGQ